MRYVRLIWRPLGAPGNGTRLDRGQVTATAGITPTAARAARRPDAERGEQGAWTKPGGVAPAERGRDWGARRADETR